MSLLGAARHYWAPHGFDDDGDDDAAQGHEKLRSEALDWIECGACGSSPAKMEMAMMASNWDGSSLLAPILILLRCWSTRP